MPQIHQSLRFKSALALALAVAAVLVVAVAAGWQVLRTIEENLGSAFARNATQYNKQRLLAPVLRECALAQRLADSEVTRRWMRDEADPATRALFFAEAERYRAAFADHSYFVVTPSRRYHFNDARTPFSSRPRYVLSPRTKEDAWFFSTMRAGRVTTLNVDPNKHIGATKVWFNVLVKDGGRPIGMAGTGLDLTGFLKRFTSGGEAGVSGVTPMFLNRDGAIQAHPDPRRIDYASITRAEGGDRASNTVFGLLSGPKDQGAVRSALEEAAASPDRLPVRWVQMDGRRQLCAVSYIPELDWFAFTAVDLQAARVMDRRIWVFLPALGIGLLAALGLAAIVAVNRLVLAPLSRLTTAVRGMSGGEYAVALPPAGSDEIGELTRSFAAMAEKVQSHTDQLEATVQERTRDLVAANERLATTNRSMGESIQCARLIQNALLPHDEMARRLADRFFVLWRPRDVVGGDWYVFRTEENGCLLGIVDCAGHGVPGAFMTMIAHTLLNTAADARGIADPAALLCDVDERLRAILDADGAALPFAPQMDAGLVYVDADRATATFAGARVSLHTCDGERVEEVRGARHAIGDRRRADVRNHTLPLREGVTFYITTDGLLDQSGGHKGFGMGSSRFEAALLCHAGRPPAEQQAAFVQTLEEYQGEYAQRDDITLLGFQPVAFKDIV